MTDCPCPSHVAERAAAERIAGLQDQLIDELTDGNRLRVCIRALSEHASQKAEEAIRLASHGTSDSSFHAGEAAAYAAMAEQLEALLPTEPPS